MTPDPKDKPVSATTVTIRRTLDARQSDVRTRILEAARQLINAHGHEAVGMELIAATAGVSRATMYRYFASKEHVVCDAALAWGHELAARIPAAVAAAGPANPLDVAIEQVVNEAASDLPMVRATMTSVLALGPVADEFRVGVRGMFTALTAGADVPAEFDASLTLLGRVFFADLALLSVGDISVDQCIDELRTAANRMLSP